MDENKELEEMVKAIGGELMLDLATHYSYCLEDKARLARAESMKEQEEIDYWNKQLNVDESQTNTTSRIVDRIAMIIGEYI